MFILVCLCLPEVDLEEGESYPRVCTPLITENIRIFANHYALIPLLIVIFALAHETICIL